MELRLWKNFRKRINSTKQPVDAEATIMDVVLKGDTSIENPVLLIEGIDFDFNYCKLAGHYYYINDIVVVNNAMYELHCVQDLMATYKTDILSMHAYIEYTENVNKYNKWIVDKRISTTGSIEVTSNQASIWSDTSGTYILVTAGLGAQVGFTSYYALTGVGQLQSLADWFYATDLATELAKSFNNPFDSVVECYYIPWNNGVYGNNVNIKFGNIESDVQAYAISSPTSPTKNSYTIDIPWRYNDWRDLSPYSVMTLYLPFYGEIILDQNKLINQSSITVDMRRDVITGEVNYFVHAGNYKAFYKADTKVPLSIGQAIGNKLTGVGQLITGGVGLVTGAISAVTGGDAGASVISGITSIASGVHSLFHEDVKVVGGQGGFGSIQQVIGDPISDSITRAILLTNYSHNFNATPANIAAAEGYPCGIYDTIGNHSGYVRCNNASINIAGLGSDKATINQYLNQGFYIE